jgi:glycosyltransferase involved in cell wall biosynthesis
LRVVKVAYLTTYYNGEIDGRFGRFHDWVHTLRDMDDPAFEFEVVALTASNPDGTLSSRPHSVLGEATDLWGSPRNKIEFCLNVPRALRDLQRIDFDILHVIPIDTIAYPIALLASRGNLIVGPDIMGYTPRRRGARWEKSGLDSIKQRLRFHLRRSLLRSAREPNLVALSRHHAANIRELHARGDPEIIPPGVSSIFRPDDTIKERKSEDAPTQFLYVGDLSTYKGYDIFLNALAGLPERVDFRATVIGSGDPDVDRIEELGVADSITIEGFIPRSELPEYYRRADFYVMPSVDENGPNTIVEALACGTPIVAADRPGTNEYAPEEAAIYVERTSAAFRDGLIEAHDRREECVASALKRASDYRAERTVEALADLYREHHREA